MRIKQGEAGEEIFLHLKGIQIRHYLRLGNKQTRLIRRPNKLRIIESLPKNTWGINIVAIYSNITIGYRRK